MNKEHILSEIRRTAITNSGVALGRARFLEETGIREADWKGVYWINWSDAVKEAGVKVSEFNRAIDGDYLLERVATLIQELGHFPQRAELTMKRNRDDAFPSEKTFRRHFGTKPFFAKAIYGWCSAHVGWEDVANLCKPIMAKAEALDQTNPDVEAAPEHGFVYLMKSGKHHKIGRTNALDRRRYELGMQLPEGIEPIHSIATDDPSGIEAYWHRRFADKHLNGEWFNLSRADIAAFKKRKFM